MKCFVCGGEMTPYFTKKIAVQYLDGLDTFEYERCGHCGLVVSKTLYEMSSDDWAKFNCAAHKDLFDGVIDRDALDPKWRLRLELQSKMFVELLRAGVFEYDWRTIDYGAGDGLIADEINSTLKTPWLKKFDAYMEPRDENYLTPTEVIAGGFDFLMSSSVFEHLLGNRGDVDKVIGLVKPNGVMALHTLICEEVPCDPDWHYLLSIPVHCTFWTNKAMSIVFEQFGFKHCSYNVEAQMWLFFRNDEAWARLVECKDRLSGTWVLADKFVDYWKVKPYRTH